MVDNAVEVFPALLLAPVDDATNFSLGLVVAVSLSVASSHLPRRGDRSMRPSTGVPVRTFLSVRRRLGTMSRHCRSAAIVAYGSAWTSVMSSITSALKSRPPSR